jgi:hypothetical protein
MLDMPRKKTPSKGVPPPPRVTRLLAAVPTPTMAPDNLSKPSAGLQDLNFKVDPEFHRHFKLTAVTKGMSMKDLLEACYKCWLEHYAEKGQLDIFLNRDE